MLGRALVNSSGRALVNSSGRALATSSASERAVTNSSERASGSSSQKRLPTSYERGSENSTFTKIFWSLVAFSIFEEIEIRRIEREFKELTEDFENPDPMTENLENRRRDLEHSNQKLNLTSCSREPRELDVTREEFLQLRELLSRKPSELDLTSFSGLLEVLKSRDVNAPGHKSA